MKVDELLELARNRRRGRLDGQGERVADDLANAIVELLGVGWPCGWPEPEARTDRHIYWESLGAVISADEARGIAIGLLRAADEAEQ